MDALKILVSFPACPSTEYMLLISGMEESGSEGLDELLISRKDTPFMKDVDYVCISDNYWLGKEKPCLTYGLRGICYFFIEVQCCAKDLHSGVFGGTVHEGMADLIYMMNTLLDKGKFSYMTSASADCPPVVVEPPFCTFAFGVPFHIAEVIREWYHRTATSWSRG